MRKNGIVKIFLNKETQKNKHSRKFCTTPIKYRLFINLNFTSFIKILTRFYPDIVNLLYREKKYNVELCEMSRVFTGSELSRI